MSELKAYTFSAMERIGLTDYYLKSEADKVIAELQSKITLASLADDCSSLRHKRCNYCSELQRQKYKRCLAMAEYCEACMNQFPFFGAISKEEVWWQKWHDKWYDLAEKFKTNSTAQ